MTLLDAINLNATPEMLQQMKSLLGTMSDEDIAEALTEFVGMPVSQTLAARFKADMAGITPPERPFASAPA